ncbi:MAG: polysaccharide biosynthesis tyrosine autokinase [Pseudomonadota bacterium]|nr:polysaccharide biosynthesis tyrosine autokinase [Pseudomonadota bacterium]
MAKFRDSVFDEGVIEAAARQQSLPPAMPTDSELGAAADGTSGAVHDRSIGYIIAELRNLTAEQVVRILQYQTDKGVRFGEAAVALGMASKDDVLYALSQQFHYPYAPEEQRKLSPDLVALNEPFSVRAESFRALRSQLMMRVFVEGEVHRALAIISPDAGDGKTYTATNVAVTLAQLGGRTLLVDADMRGPRVHDVFQLRNQAGLSGILSGRADRQVIQQVAGIPSLFVLPVGTTPPNPLELVERPAFGLLMRELASKFDHVVVDTPAAVYGADAAVIAAKCGAAVVVARKDTSRAAALRELVASLQGAPVNFAGVVFNEY